MKYGLVMEGGAMRGLFTAGVTDVLMENEIEFDSAAGVSAGACFGCNYKSRQRGRAVRYNLRFCRDHRYCSVRSLLFTGDMFGAEFCYHTIPDKLDLFDYKTFAENPMDFFLVATDVETGKPVYFRMKKADRNELEWMRASASMPFVSRIVNINGRKLLDGGISDSIPLGFLERQGCGKNVVILTQPRDYVKKPASLSSAMKLFYRKYPELINACQSRHKMYNEELEYIRSAEAAGRAFIIAPPEKLPIGHVEHDPDKLLEIYRTGRKTALLKLEELMKFMNIQPHSSGS